MVTTRNTSFNLFRVKCYSCSQDRVKYARREMPDALWHSANRVLRNVRRSSVPLSTVVTVSLSVQVGLLGVMHGVTPGLVSRFQLAFCEERRQEQMSSATAERCCAALYQLLSQPVINSAAKRSRLRVHWVILWPHWVYIASVCQAEASVCMLASVGR